MSLPTTVNLPLLSPEEAVVIVILPPNSSVLGVPKADAATSYTRKYRTCTCIFKLY